MGASTQRDVISLNGWWHAWFDTAADWRHEVPLLPGTPLDQVPVRPPSDGWAGLEEHKESLRVPGTWEETEPGYHGVAWHWRPLLIPDHWAGRVVRLRFEAVRLRAEVYLDTQLVGYDLEGYTPFEIDLTGRVRAGERHELAVRVTNPGGSGPWLDDTPMGDQPLRWAGRELPAGSDFGGIWGDVSLIATGTTYLADLWAEPAPDLDAVKLWVEVRHLGGQRTAMLHTRILDPDGAVVGETGPEEVALTTLRVPVGMEIPIADPQPWAPDHPYLYTAVVSLAGKEGADIRQASFGLRRARVREGQFYLNGQPLFLRAASSWGWYPENLAFPTPALAEREVRAARALGLNALVARGRPAHPALLDAADRLGLLILQAPGSIRAGEAMGFPETGAQAFRQALAEERLRRLVQCDRHHPSVVGWDLAEGRGRSAGLPDYAQRLIRTIRQADPSRPVLWPAGSDQVAVYNPGAARPARLVIRPAQHQRANVWRQELEETALRPAAQAGRRPLLVGLPSFAGLPDLPDLVRRYGDRLLPGSDGAHWRGWLRTLQDEFTVYGLGRTFADSAAFCRATRAVQSEAVTRMVELNRLNSTCSGYLLDGWTSHEPVGVDGLIDPWRQLKVDEEALQQANAPLAIVIAGLPAAARVAEPCRATIWAISELGAQRGLALDWQFLRPGGLVATQGASSLDLIGRISRQRLGGLRLTSEEPGCWRLRVALRRGGDVIASRERTIWVTQTPSSAWPAIQVHDSIGQLAGWRARWGASWVDDRPDGPVDRLLLIGMQEAGQLVSIVDQAGRNGGRVALLLSRIGRMGRRHGPDDPLGTQGWEGFSVRGHPAGGWVFSHAHPLLEGVAEPGIWGAAQAGLFPWTVIRGLPGDVLAGACSFPGWPKEPLAPPRIGAALSLFSSGAAEVLLCTLPIVEAIDRGGPVAERLLYNLARWLARQE